MSESLQLLSVKQLRELLRKKHLKVSGLKVDLIKRLLESDPSMFEKLPNEIILGICEQMDTQTLGRFVQTSTRIKNVCTETLNKRKKNRFLDLFEYDHVEQGDNKVFHNCFILKSIGKFKPGDIVESIGIQITLYLWENEKDFEEETIII